MRKWWKLVLILIHSIHLHLSLAIIYIYNNVHQPNSAVEAKKNEISDHVTSKIDAVKVNTSAMYDDAVNRSLEIAKQKAALLLEKENEYKRQKELDLLNGRLVWSDSFWGDFWTSTKNSHPLIGICFADALHPYAKKERLLVLLTSFVVALSLTIGEVR